MHNFVKEIHEKQLKIDKEISHLSQRNPTFKKPKTASIQKDSLPISIANFHKFTSSFINDLSQLWADNSTKDCFLIFEDSTYKIPVHKFILVFWRDIIKIDG